MKVRTPFNHLVPKDMVENLRWRAKIYQTVLDRPEYAEVLK